MKIEYLGHSCFKITTKNGRTVLTDPYTGVGYELPQPLTAEFVTVSHEHFDHNYTNAIHYKQVIKTLSGVKQKDLEITGIKTFHDNCGGKLRGENTVYLIKADGICVCHLGDIGENCELALIERLEAPDVLLVPVGGTYTIDAVGAKAYISALKPKIAILMHYKPSDGKIDIVGAEKFLALCEGEEVYAPTENWIEISGETLQRERTLFVYLQRGE